MTKFLENHKGQLRCALHPLWIQHMIQLPATLCYPTDPQGVFPNQKFNDGCADHQHDITPQCPQTLLREGICSSIWDSQRASCTSCRGLQRESQAKACANLTTSMPIWTHCTSKSIRLYVVWIIYLYTFVHTTNRYYARRLIQHDFATVLLPPLEFARRFDNRLEYGWDITNHFS